MKRSRVSRREPIIFSEPLPIVTVVCVDYPVRIEDVFNSFAGTFFEPQEKSCGQCPCRMKTQVLPVDTTLTTPWRRHGRHNVGDGPHRLLGVVQRGPHRSRRVGRDGVGHTAHRGAAAHRRTPRAAKVPRGTTLVQTGSYPTSSRSRRASGTRTVPSTAGARIRSTTL